MRTRKLRDVMGSHHEGFVAKIGSGPRYLNRVTNRQKRQRTKDILFGEELFRCLHECDLVMR